MARRARAAAARIPRMVRRHRRRQPEGPRIHEGPERHHARFRIVLPCGQIPSRRDETGGRLMETADRLQTSATRRNAANRHVRRPAGRPAVGRQSRRRPVPGGGIHRADSP